MAKPDNRYDPAALWDTFSSELRREIGIAAIIVAGGSLGMARGDYTWDATFAEGVFRLEELIGPRVPASADGPDLAAIGVRACHTCGCTDRFGLHDGYEWTGANICSACDREVVF